MDVGVVGATEHRSRDLRPGGEQQRGGSDVGVADGEDAGRRPGGGAVERGLRLAELAEPSDHVAAPAAALPQRPHPRLPRHLPAPRRRPPQRRRRCP